MPVLGNVHPINILISFRDVISLLARVFILLIDTATQEVPMKNIWKKLSVQFLRYAIELLNVAHVTHYVKWRPIVTTFGTLIENISRIFFDDFMSNINCGIGVLHVKRQILTDLFVTSFLCSLKFSLFHLIGHTTRCLQTKYWKCSMAQVSFQWIEYNPISILYKFQIDISSNSREIKYQNIGRTHRHTDTHTDIQTHRQTGWKQ